MDARYRDLTAASALAGDRTRDAGGGRQPEVLTLSPEKALIKRRHHRRPPDRNVSGTPPKLLRLTRLVQFAEKLTWDLHGSRPGVPKCIGNLGPSQKFLELVVLGRTARIVYTVSATNGRK
ncbi:hypothetical protein Scep_013104 [Stephania cephalantha]|uniref:Uncharacterized protein n=1 Tax=Stephania cephalantha TaxID=152367 RepID=A0AAP0JHP3_9MAGN